jgi:murein L,D-transpeptidase YcbB/YkuD
MHLRALLAAILLPCLAAAPPRAGDLEAGQTARLLQQSAEEGLDPADYRQGTLAGYAHDLAFGRASLRALDRDVLLPEPTLDTAALVMQAQRDGRLQALPAGLAPPFPEYAALKSALARYRAIAAAGGWARLDAAVKNYDSPAQAAALRRRLSFEDAAPADPAAPLQEAVRRFQARHGLEADGVIGRATLAELNVTAAARADTIMANMERWRWLPRSLEPDHVVINAAAAELTLVLAGKPALVSRVIVGRPQDPTPILRAEAAAITVNPPWNVPRTIAAREMLPRLKRDPAWLARQDMILLDGPAGDPQGLTVQWRSIPAGTFPYRIRQHPGPANPLGQVKLELPNRFDVYLHDTPGRSAFARPDRHLSHGCVRVEQILPLASYAISADLSSMEKIVAAIDAGETQTVPLQRKLPVYFLYWTAFAQGDGSIAFRPDIYGRDRRMLAALHSRALMAQARPAGCLKA